MFIVIYWITQHVAHVKLGKNAVLPVTLAKKTHLVIIGQANDEVLPFASIWMDGWRNHRFEMLLNSSLQIGVPPKKHWPRSAMQKKHPLTDVVVSWLWQDEAYRLLKRNPLSIFIWGGIHNFWCFFLKRNCWPIFQQILECLRWLDHVAEHSLDASMAERPGTCPWSYRGVCPWRRSAQTIELI